MENRIRQIVDLVVSSLLDPNPIRFYPLHERGVKLVKKALNSNPPNTSILFKRPLIRNEFLLGCLDFTEKLKVEYLIIGYGKKRGSGTDILVAKYSIGSENSVEICEETNKLIEEYIQKESRNEIIIFHNHPHNWINTVIDNIPLPSPNDRGILLRKYCKPLILFKRLLNRGSLRFYLGENGFVREYRAPNVLKLLSPGWTNGQGG